MADVVDYRGFVIDIDGVQRPYFEAAGRHELVVQVCSECRTPQYPPAVLCGACSGDDLFWQSASGNGRLYACLLAQHGVRQAFPTPYAFGLVELELPDGEPSVRLLSDILDVDGVTPLRRLVADGTPVKVVFETLGDGLALPRFGLIGKAENS
jgi:uncharacterized protein